MTMVCDRCGDCFYWYEEIDFKENEPLYGNSVQRTIIDDRYVPLNWIPDVTPIALCPLLHGCTQRLVERRTEVSKKISDILPKTKILAQLAEEASELAQAALKLRRALDGTNPTPKSVEECLENIQEEMADVFCLPNHVWQVRRKRWNLNL